VRVTPTALPDVLVIEPRVFRDERGAFRETWHVEGYSQVTALPFVHDNVSVSRRGVVRGLHLQEPHVQGRLVTVLAGAAFDVAVDLRRGSPTFGHWVAEELSEENGRQLWIPPGFAHGFQALAEGYLAGAGSTLLPAERELLVLAGEVMTLEQAYRFLGDHLAGDTYYQISRPGQNLDRARTQIALVKALQRHEPALNAYVASLS